VITFKWRKKVTRILGLTLLLMGASGAVFAAITPEIDPASGVSAIALLAGAVLIIRARRKN